MPHTLLLADDSVTIQKVVGITFANEDVELITVDNGADALARAKDLKPDMIMADVAMPGLGGYELCAAIRRDPELSKIPVLLLTGTFEAYDEQKGLSVGVSGHIAKPFEAQALISQFYALVGQDVTRVVDPSAALEPPAQPRPVAPQPVAATRQPPVHPPIQEIAPEPPPKLDAATPTPLLGSDTLSELPNTDFSPPRAAQPAPPAAAAPGMPLVADPDAVPSMPDMSDLASPEEFSFSDLDFNESTPANTNTDTGIFGEDSSSGVGLAAPAAPESGYGETAFLDPNAARVAAPAATPPAPDPLADTIPEDPFGDPNEDTSTFYQPMIERLNPASPEPAPAPAAMSGAPSPSTQAIAEAIPWADATPDPVREAPAPVSAAAQAAAPPVVAEPIPEPASRPGGIRPEAATPIIDALMAAEPISTTPAREAPPRPRIEAQPFDAPADSDTAPLAEAEPLEIEPEDDDDLEAATVAAPEAFELAASRFAPNPPEAELFAPEPEPEGDLVRADATEPMGALPGIQLDPTDVRNAVEKVAWEAFGALQEQLMREVTAKAESALWEILPQLAERLITEAIEKLKAEG